MLSAESKERRRVSATKYREANREKIRAKRLARYRANPEFFIAKDREWRAKNKDRVRATKRKHYESHKESYDRRYRAYKSVILQKKYGIDQAQYDEIFERQNKKCAICKTNSWTGRGPAIDHDHVTGKVRGILCSRCNSAIGFIDDRQAVARAIVAYLRKHQEEAWP